MSSPHSVRKVLKDATADRHARVDAIFSAADLGTAQGYGRFLAAQAAAHLPVEKALDDGGIAAVVADWPERRRGHLIRDDLAKLGLAPPPAERPPALHDVAAMLGAVYVLEGSRLGGALLRRTVPPHLPAAFLSANRPAAWRDLICLLDARLLTRKDTDAAIAGAQGVFAVFEQSGQRLL